MMEFDHYVTTDLQEIVDQESSRRTITNRPHLTKLNTLQHPAVNPRSTQIIYRIKTLQKRIQKQDKNRDSSTSATQANLQRKK
jgi:hypothetical protein